MDFSFFSAIFKTGTTKAISMDSISNNNNSFINGTLFIILIIEIVDILDFFHANNQLAYAELNWVNVIVGLTTDTTKGVVKI
jgi:hypothetical protein